MENGRIIIKPRKSRGGIYMLSVAIGISILLLSLLIIFSGTEIKETIMFWILSILFGLISAIMFYFAFSYYTLRYIIYPTERKMEIGWGGFRIVCKDIKYVALYPEIKEGIRIGGAALPGYFVGRFGLLLNGRIYKVGLYATSSKEIVIIATADGKIYGVTPEKPDEFIGLIKTYCMAKEPGTETLPKNGTVPNGKRFEKLSRIITLSVILIAGIFPLYILYGYFTLPDVPIPMHWGIDGHPDYFGTKMDYLVSGILLWALPSVFSSVLIYYIRKSRRLGETKYGVYVRLLALVIISTMFLSEIIFTEMIRAYISSP